MTELSEGNPTTKAAAQRLAYRRWSGEPAGVYWIEGRCAADVPDGGRSVLSHQCRRSSGHGPEELYCSHHANLIFKTNLTITEDEQKEKM